MNEKKESVINQGGNNNLNIVNNSGSVNINTQSECNLSFEEVNKSFIEASEDLNLHKSYFGENHKLYIKRKVVYDIGAWIDKDLNSTEGPIAVLAGNTGYGKSVVAKQLLQSLENKKYSCLSFKI